MRRLLDESRLATDILDASGWRTRGSALYYAGRLDDSLRAYDRALALEPDRATAHHDRGVVLAQIGQFPGALGAFERAVELDPTSARLTKVEVPS